MYILLFCFWLLLCGSVTWEICGIGLLVTGGLGLLEWKLFGYHPRTELRLICKTPLFLCYVLVLVWEILKSGLGVMGCILFKSRNVNPTLVTFRTTLRTDFGRFLLANSITLTPGTITIRVEGDRVTVHCLDKSMLDTSENSVFQRWIRRLEA